jgi:GDP-4-dehydro-6-deoxy-D-mannose reductase
LKEVINGFKSITTIEFDVKSPLINQMEQQVDIKPVKLMKLGWKQAISFESSLKDILNFYRRKNNSLED